MIRMRIGSLMGPPGPRPGNGPGALPAFWPLPLADCPRSPRPEQLDALADVVQAAASGDGIVGEAAAVVPEMEVDQWFGPRIGLT